MIVVFCLLLVLGLGRCQDNDLPSKSEIESSINRTIEEVERKVREDPSLPRLTRQDIVKILYNITSQEINEYKDKGKIEEARKLYQRALMVVLPYNAEDSEGELNDLYTKPPITQIIPDFLKVGYEKMEFDKGKPKNVEFPAKHLEDNTPKDSLPSAAENLVSTRGLYKTTPSEKDNQSTTIKNRYKNHKETYSEVQTKIPLKEALKFDSAPVKFTFNLENLQKNPYTTEQTTTKRPIYKTTLSENRKDDLEIIYSTSITTEPTIKMTSEEITIDLKPKPSSSELKTNQNILSSNQWHYNAPPSTTLKPTTFKYKNREKISFLPTTIKIQPEDGMIMSTTKRPEIFMEPSEYPAEVVQFTSTEAPMYVTPMSTGTSQKSKYSSTYSINSGGFRSAPTTTTSSPMRQEVMDLLASIGLRPDNKSNVEDVFERNKEISDTKFQIPNTNSIFHTTVSGLTSSSSNSPSIVNQNTFEGPGSEIKKGVENLTPDVQLLFQRFGLQTSNLDRLITTTERTTVNLNSYTNFKPLPTSNVENEDMKEFLAKFGLGISDNRRQKAMKQETTTASLIEAVPSNMRGILENIGLITSSHKKSKAIPTIESMDATESSKYHVFKPHEVNVKDGKQRAKINELLDTLKKVKEGQVDIQKVKKVANELLETTKTLKDGPDPLSLEEIIRIYNEDVKNEVKRQQEQLETTTDNAGNQNASSTMIVTESTETAPTTVTDSSRAASDLLDSLSTTAASSTSANLLALEESFGGSTKAPDPVIPARQRSGLYFLVDWNSFLEVGEEPDKVNLRFQPKVGDRSRFLPVTIP